MTVSSHPATEELSAYIDEELERRAVEDLDAHLASCLECRHRLEGLRRVVAGLQRIESVAPPPALEEMVLGQLALRPPRTLAERLAARRRGSRRVRSYVGTIFAVVLALVIISLLFTQAVQRRQGAAVEAGEVVPPADSVEWRAGVDRQRIGERLFARTAGGWIEVGVGEPQRVLGANDPERAELLRTLPGLEALAGAGAEGESQTPTRIVLEWRGESVALELSPLAESRR